MAALKLSTTLIIVIAVSGLVGCLLILFIIFRCCRRPKSAPLPPIQPLAHDREKELPHPRSFRNSLAPNQLGEYESDSSLLRQSRKPSFQTAESEGTPSSSNHSFLSPPPQTNAAFQSSPRSADDEQTSTAQHYVSTTRQARSVSRGTRRPRSRVISTASSNNIFAQVSPRPTSIIRGAPHSALSSVQIVLPAPLAPQLQSHLVSNSFMVETYSNPDLDPLSQAVPRSQRNRTNSRPQSQYRSLDTRDQPNPSDSQTLSRGRNTSERSIQSQLNNELTAPPVPSLDDRSQFKPISQDPRDGQGNLMVRPPNSLH